MFTGSLKCYIIQLYCEVLRDKMYDKSPQRLYSLQIAKAIFKTVALQNYFPEGLLLYLQSFNDDIKKEA